MKITLRCVFLWCCLLTTAEIFSQGFSPSNISNLALWLSADTGVTLNGSTVSNWADQSGNVYDASQGTVANQPLLINPVELCGKPAIKFDGLNDSLGGVLIPNLETGSVSLFIVGRTNILTGSHAFFSVNNSASGMRLWQSTSNFEFRNNGGPQITAPAIATAYCLLGVVKNFGVNVQLYKNNVLASSTASAILSGTFPNTNYSLGKVLAANSSYLNGEIAEIILYKSALNTVDRQQVETYLENKYAPPVNLGSDITVPYGFCPVTLNAGTCYTNYAWSNGANTSTISVSKGGEYSVTTTDIFGRQISDTILVTYPNVKINTSDTTICAGDIIGITTQLASDSGYTFLWSNAQTDSAIQINSTGNYSVVVTDGIGCSAASDTMTLSLDNFASSVSLGADIDSICAGNTIGLQTPANGWENLQFTWTDNSHDSLFAIPSTGTYSVTVTNARGCAATDNIDVTVIGNAPNVSFTDSSLCLGETYTPVNSTNSTIANYLWDFGDGHTDTAANPSHIYSGTGTYTVSLSVTTSAGCSATASKQVIIKPNPVATFQTTIACANNAYQFIDMSTGAIAQWDWNFGDGSTHSSQTNPSHTYSSANTFPVTLTVTGSNACVVSSTVNLQVVTTYALPSTPVLQSPADSFLTPATIVDFSWSPSVNANSYTLLVDTNSSFASASVYSGIITTSYLATLISGQQFYWKVVAFNICGATDTSDTRTFTYFVPTFIPNLGLWLAADNGVTLNGNNVSHWADQSSNFYDAVQNTSGAQPALVNPSELCGKPALKFDGGDSLVGQVIPNLETSSMSLFIVGRTASLSGNNSFFSVSGLSTGMRLWRSGSSYEFRNNSGTQITTPAFANSYCLLDVVKDFGTNVRLFKNGALASSTTNPTLAGTFANSNYLLGKVLGSNTSFLTGEIAEIILYKSALTTTERQQVETYLENKYAQSVNLGPDVNIAYGFCPVTISAGACFTNYVWSNGATTSSINVNTSGIYSVTATDIFGRATTDSIRVTYPNVGINTADTTICSGDMITIGTQLPSPLNYSFHWQDAQTTSTINVSAAGNYSVTVTDNTGVCSATSNVMVLSLDDFPNSVSLGPNINTCAGNTIGLQTPSTGWDSLQFHWSDNTTDSLFVIPASNITNTYSVTITNHLGCVATSSIGVTVNASAPNVVFTDSNLCLGGIYTPHNSSVSTDTFHITDYLWDFGDGFNDTAASPSHIYSAVGSYNVSLTVTTSSFCSKTLIHQVIVRPNPVAFFQANIACTGNAFQFTDMSAPPLNGTIIHWDWNFGDGSLHDTLQNTLHTYTSAGSIPVTLSVTADNGCIVSAINNLQVVSTFASPVAPVLQNPADNFIAPATTVTFSWSAASNASSYTLLIATDAQFNSVTPYSGITNTQITVNLGSGTQFYWKVVAYNICGAADTSLVRTFTYFIPSFLPNLTLWLKADSGIVLNPHGGNGVEQWIDRTLNHYNATQFDSIPQPLFVNPTQIVKPAVQFDGIRDSLIGQLIPNLETGSLSLFIIGKTSTISGSRAFFAVNNAATGMRMWHSGSNFEFRNNGTPLTAPAAYKFVADDYCLMGVVKDFGISLELYKNSALAATSQTAGLTGSFSNTNYNIGKVIGQSSSFLNGEIAEIILYKSKVDSSQRDQVEEYLYNKYSPPVNLGPDIVQSYSLCPVTINASTRFKIFEWSTGESTSSITITKSGTYSVTVTDVFDRTSSDEINITLPYSTMSPLDTTICLGQTVTIHPVLLSSASSYQFLWNDSIQTTPSIQTSVAGNYYVVIVDSNHCSITSDVAHVAVDTISLLSILPDDTAMCIGNDLAVNTGSYAPAQVLWSTSSASTFITIATAGTYSVSVTDIYSCSTNDSVRVTIKGTAPHAFFVAATACYGEQTGFHDLTLPVLPDSIHHWNWNFGDDSSSLLQNPSHAFSAPGSYTVVLMLTTDSGCTGVAVDTVSVYAKPLARYSYPGIICAGNSSQIFDNSIVLADSITQWRWLFNQTDSFFTSSINYSFPIQGNIPVALKVTTANGCSNEISGFVEVFPPFKADFSFSQVCLGDSTKFVDLSSSLSVVRWQWNFGDGSFFSTVPDPHHLYLVSGSYNTQLAIENAIGCTDTIGKNILIVQNPIADFTNLSLCVDLNYTPKDTSSSPSEPIHRWDWNIAGTPFSDNRYPQYYFADTGIYNVKLLVTTNSGCKDSVSKTVQVHPNPVSLFAMAPLYGEAPVDVSFTNNSSNAVSYIWNYGDGSPVSTDENTTHTYTQNDTLQITLTVTSDFGCTNTSAQTFYISHTDLDLSVDKVESVAHPQADGSVLVSIAALVSNVGTRTVTHIHINATLGTGGVITEDWNGLLPSGQIMEDTFHAQFVVAASNANSYVCVEAVAVNHGETEMRTDNNRQCASLTGTIQLVGPSPNPAFNQSTLGIILPKEGKVTIAIADVVGHIVVPQTELDLPAGRSDFEIPTGQMLPAEYFIRVTYNDEDTVRKFILQK